MSRRSRRKRTVRDVLAPNGTLSVVKAQLPKILAGLLGVGALSGTGATYMKGDGADERAKAVEVRLDRTEADAGHLARAVQRLNNRTTRIETLIELELDQHKVPQSKRPARPVGPDEE